MNAKQFRALENALMVELANKNRSNFCIGYRLSHVLQDNGFSLEAIWVKWQELWPDDIRGGHVTFSDGYLDAAFHFGRQFDHLLDAVVATLPN